MIDDKQRHLEDKKQYKEEKLRQRMLKANAGFEQEEIKEEDIENFESSMSWLKNSLRFFDTKFMDSIIK